MATLHGAAAVISVTHVITGLDLGGAEMVLYRLLDRLDPRRFRSSVISLTTVGPLTSSIASLGIPVRALGYRSLLSAPIVIGKVARSVRSTAPHVVQTWMYHADLLGGVGARLGGARKIAWGLHAGPPPPSGGSVLMQVGLRAAARLSRKIPESIVCCSHETRSVHARLGYDAEKMRVITNGFPVLNPPRDASRSVRAEIGASDSSLLVGRVGRFHPQKDHSCFLQAFAALRSRFRDVHALLIGAGLDVSNTRITESVHALGLDGHVHLLGSRKDVVRLNAACDISVSSSSYGEGLPIVLGDAMAVGTPVVTTDVGDSADLVGDSRRVVPVRDPDRLARAMSFVLDLPRVERMHLGTKDRERVLNCFGIQRMVDNYAELYEELAQQAP